jgi:Flp pilus assembly protein TadG
VEFALVVPLLMIVLFGIISYGFLLSTRQGVSQAAAEGARAAAVTPGNDDAKKSAAWAAVADALDANGVTGCTSGALVPAGKGTCNVTIAACDPPAASPRCAKVEVVLNYDTILPGFDIAVPDKLTYTAVSQVS